MQTPSNDPIHRFAVEETEDGRFRLHIRRLPHATSTAYVSTVCEVTFASEAEAKAHAKEHFGAGDDDFASSPGHR